MEMKVTGKVIVVGDNIDTDQIYPGCYLALTDPKEIGSHCLEGVSKDISSNFPQGGIVVAGRNFGCGSSREHAVYCLQYAGVPCVLAETCSRIYYRNAINNGFPVLFVSGISEAIKTGKLRNGDTLEVDLSTGDIHDVDTGADLHGDAVSDLEHEIMEAGGLFQYMKEKAKA